MHHTDIVGASVKVASTESVTGASSFSPDLKMAQVSNGPGVRRQAFAKADLSKKQSMAFTLGREGKFVAKGSAEGRAIGVFTSGGDAQGRTFHL